MYVLSALVSLIPIVARGGGGGGGPAECIEIFRLKARIHHADESSPCLTSGKLPSAEHLSDSILFQTTFPLYPFVYVTQRKHLDVIPKQGRYSIGYDESSSGVMKRKILYRHVYRKNTYIYISIYATLALLSITREENKEWCKNERGEGGANKSPWLLTIAWRSLPTKQ